MNLAGDINKWRKSSADRTHWKYVIAFEVKSRFTYISINKHFHGGFEAQQYSYCLLSLSLVSLNRNFWMHPTEPTEDKAFSFENSIWQQHQLRMFKPDGVKGNGLGNLHFSDISIFEAAIDAPWFASIIWFWNIHGKFFFSRFHIFFTIASTNSINYSLSSLPLKPDMGQLNNRQRSKEARLKLNLEERSQISSSLTFIAGLLTTRTTPPF